MGSMPRREERERLAQERAPTQPALDCEACGALTPAFRFRYFRDRLICEACEHQNAQSRVRSVPRELLAPSTICINFIRRDGVTIQAMHIDPCTMLGPQILCPERGDASPPARLSRRPPRNWLSLTITIGDGVTAPCRSRSHPAARTSWDCSFEGSSP
jgi:hypothetical protein